MDIQKLLEALRRMPENTEDFPFDETTLVFRIGGKIFALTDLEDDPARVNLKCDPDLAEDLRSQHQSVIPGYHMNKKHWNTVILDGSIAEDRILWMIDHSYELVMRSLSRKERERLNLPI
jgi:predicted DNA-binding protein (MmcQ/YjbR family)